MKNNAIFRKKYSCLNYSVRRIFICPDYSQPVSQLTSVVIYYVLLTCFSIHR